MGSYAYSKSHRALEVVGLLAATVALIVNGRSVVLSVSGPAAIVAVALVFVGIACADIVSGVVHWAADTYGDESIPVFGGFVRTFREHHSDQEDITRHDWIETNGDVCVFSVPVHILVLLTVRDPFVLATILGLFLGSYSNSQIHKWSHTKEPPPWVRFLQRRRVFLSPDHHSRHHSGAHLSNYCITTGWTNALLDGLNFFRTLEAVLSRLGIQSRTSGSHQHAK